MADKKKLILAVLGLVAAVAAAGLMGYKAMAPPAEEIVGTLDPPGGAAKGMRDAEAPPPAANPDGAQKPAVGVEGGKGGE